MKIVTLILAAYFMIAAGLYAHYTYVRSDKFIRNRVVMLHSNHGSCSGIEIKAPSGKNYILTAGHCKILLENNEVLAENEQGKDIPVHFIAEDSFSDLMLLTARDSNSIPVGRHMYEHQHLHTLTHGRGYPTYRTDGEFLAYQMTDVMVSEIQDPSQEESCRLSKFKIQDTLFGKICILHTVQTISTAAVVPGSSGGPLLNDDGQLVGIVSAGGPDSFSTFVSLPDIREFLKNK